MSAEENLALTTSIDRASQGELDALRDFYRAFIDGTLFVPTRVQQHSLSYAPNYPSELFSLLGVQEDDRVLIPVFSSPALSKEWCGHELELRTLTGQELLSIVPESWWLCVNPSAEISKELSPWEISELRLGKSGIDAIIDDILSDGFGEFEFQPCDIGEYSSLRDATVKFARATPHIRALYVLRESTLKDDAQSSSSVLIGADIYESYAKELGVIQSRLQEISDHAQIGGERVKVIAGTGLRSLTLGIFKGSEPYFTKNLIARFLGYMRNLP